MGEPEKKPVESETEINRVKELLFGHELRELKSHVQALDERLKQSIQELNESITSRLGLLETYLKREVASLSERGKGEQAERRGAVSELAHVLERIESEQERIRGDLLRQAKQLSDEFASKILATVQASERSFASVNTSKIDRKFLAEALKGVAEELLESERPHERRKAA